MVARYGTIKMEDTVNISSALFSVSVMLFFTGDKHKKKLRYYMAYPK